MSKRTHRVTGWPVRFHHLETPPPLPVAGVGTRAAAQDGGGDGPFVQGSQCLLTGQETEAQGGSTMDQDMEIQGANTGGLPGQAPHLPDLPLFP